MHAITRESQAKDVAERWERQYRHGSDWSQRSKIGDTGKIHRDLVALGPSPNPDDIDRIIGNSSWTDVPTCSECSAPDLPLVVQLGQEPDYESSTAWICRECLLKAVAILPQSTSSAAASSASASTNSQSQGWSSQK